MPAAPTARPRAQQPVRRPEEHSEWAHGPEAAAINASLWTALLAVVIRLTHFPPGLALLVGAVMAVALVAAGQMRRPRRLALRSLVYRGTAMFTAGGWLWLETASFSHIGGTAVAGLAFVGAGLALAVGGIMLLRHGKVVLALITGCFTLAALMAGVALMIAADVSRVFTTAATLSRATYLPWLWHGLIALGVLAAVFSVLGQACANHEAEMDEKIERALLMRSHGREMLLMQQLLREVCRQPNLTVVPGGFNKWDNGAGEDYEIDGSADGVTPADIDRQKDTLAARLALPIGCGIEAVQGAHRGRIIVAVSKINRIKESHLYPPAYKMRSIYNGLPVGVRRDGTEISIALRESSAFVFGQKRSGKTTTLFDIAAGICQCTDALLWVIDFGGGGVALPFLYPFAEGKVKTPAVDWVATTVDEAKKMAELALAIALDRKTFYKHRKRKANTNLLPLDAEVPEIVIMIDEGAEAMGETAGMDYDAKEVRGILEKIVRTAGDSGVNIVFSGLAATQDVIDRMTLSQLAIRIGMRVTEGRELAYGFDQDYGLNPADIPYQGSGFIKASHEEGTRVFRAYLLEPEQMGEIAIVTEPWRPELDERGRQLGGEVYTNRWTRTAHLLTDESGTVLIDIAAAGTAVAVATRPDVEQPPAAVPPTGGDAPAVEGAARGPVDDEPVDIAEGLRPFNTPGSPDDIINRASQSADRLRDAANEAAGPSDGDAPDQKEWDRKFAALVNKQFDWSDPRQWPEMPAPPGIETSANPQGPKVLEALIRHHGESGIQAKDIKEKLRLGGKWGPPVVVTDQTIHEWLKGAAWLALRKQRMPYVHKDFEQPRHGA